MITSPVGGVGHIQSGGAGDVSVDYHWNGYHFYLTYHTGHGSWDFDIYCPSSTYDCGGNYL